MSDWPRKSISRKNVNYSSFGGGGQFFGILPDELILKILLLLPLKDVALKIMHINNRRLTNLCQDPFIWRRINLKNEQDVHTACKMIHMAGGRLENLTLNCSLGVGESRMLAVMALANSPRLATFMCHPALLTKDVMKAIGESRCLRMVITMRVINTTPGSSERLRTAEFVSNITSFKNLTCIAISHICLDITDNADWVKTLADTCSEKLQALYLPSCIGKALNDEILQHLLEKLRRKIRILNIWGGPMLTDASIIHVKNCKQLQQLHLHDLTNIGKNGLNAITEVSIRLQRLGLTGLKLPGRSIAEAFAGKILDKLIFLNMYGCVNLDDFSLAEVAMSCPNVKILHLSECKNVAGDGIGSILRYCKKLNRLQL